jgi:16S rRNA (cytosine967-C5)-methyltransferase
LQGYASRDAALNILMDQETTGAFLKDLFPRHTQELSPQDKALVREICLGVIRNLTLLDFNIDRHAPKKPRGVLRGVLRLTAYQLFFMDVPDFASVNVGVELAKFYEGAPQAGFVNVVLKKMSKEGIQRESGHSFGTLAVNFSHPEWLVRRWYKHLGRKGLMQALERNNQEAPLWLRVNPAKVAEVSEPGGARESAASGNEESSRAGSGEAAVEAVQAKLAALGVETERDGYAPLFLRILDAKHVKREGGTPEGIPRGGGKEALHSELFKSGQIAFQDPAAWLVAELADWAPGASLLDMCSAPGGKAACMAERARYLGSSASPPMVCSDISFRRLTLIKDAVDRLGHGNLLPMVMDSAHPALRATFDVIVVDAPCSNLGVLRRRPEARWTKSPADLQRLADLQRTLLDQAAALASPKGRIVYATCSPEEEETAGVVRTFLAKHPDWVLADAAEHLPAWSVKQGFLWIHPGESEYDGFFAARLERRPAGAAK